MSWGYPQAKRGTFECDSCGAEISYTSETELKNDGWVFHRFEITGTTKRYGQFICCDACEMEFEQRRNQPVRGL